MPPTFQVLANTLLMPNKIKGQKQNDMKRNKLEVPKCEVAQVTCIQMYLCGHSSVSFPSFHPLCSKPQRRIHDHTDVGGAVACLLLTLAARSRTRADVICLNSATETRETSSYRCMPVHLSHLSMFAHVVVETRKRSPPCLIVACRRIHARACNNQTWRSAACYLNKEMGWRGRRKQ
jgi:hypothetical protein